MNLRSNNFRQQMKMQHSQRKFMPQLDRGQNFSKLAIVITDYQQNDETLENALSCLAIFIDEMNI